MSKIKNAKKRDKDLNVLYSAALIILHSLPIVNFGQTNELNFALLVALLNVDVMLLLKRLSRSQLSKLQKSEMDLKEAELCNARLKILELEKQLKSRTK